MHLWDPPFCGDIDMRIARDGTWYHEGNAIRRLAMVNLFSSILMVEESEYFLVTPVEKVRIQVEDCPFVATQMETEGSGRDQVLVFTTNTEESVTVDTAHAISVTTSGPEKEPHPIVHVRNGLNALINRSVFYRLVELAEEAEASKEEGCTQLGVWSKQTFFSLGDIESK